MAAKPAQSLPLARSYAPMEARLVDALPLGPEWQYEPKWDGFRCIVFRDGTTVGLMSKAGKPLGRYFPELVARMLAVPAQRFVIDGEIVVPFGSPLSFDELLLRIHPAKSRVERLAAERPASFVAFDILVDPDGRSLVDEPLQVRRARLEEFFERFVASDDEVTARHLLLSPATDEMSTVKQWFRSVGGGLDGVIAKRLDIGYQSGERTGMGHGRAPASPGGASSFRPCPRPRSRL